MFLALILANSLLGQRAINDSLTLPTSLPTGIYQVEMAWSQFQVPIALAHPPGETNQLYVAERAGGIRVITDLSQNTLQAEYVLDLSSLRSVTSNGENGLLGLAFHPRFSETKRIFVFYTHNLEGIRRNRVSSFLITGDDPIRADPDSEIIYFDQLDQANNHNGGDIHFGPDGYLYVALGDEGGANDRWRNSQQVDKDFFAGIVRLDVDKFPGNVEPTYHPAVPRDSRGKAFYSVPIGNPLVAEWQQGGSDPDSDLRLEFYAIGLRNPWRMAFDPPTGRLFAGDVGQVTREEVDIIVKGGNYGWAIREGFIAFNEGPGNLIPPPAFGELLDPIHDYPREDGQSVTGGVVYRGIRFPELEGAYIFGDYELGHVWALIEREGGYDRILLTNYPRHYEYGLDPSNGDVLISGGDGNIRRLVRGDGWRQPAFPSTLSETGAFKSLVNLEPEDGIMAYEPNLSFWSDHGIKSRWVAVPNATIGYHRELPWAFPPGTVWIKHFELPLERNNGASSVRVETRFLVKTENGVYGLSYRWKEDGSDAILVGEEGVDIDFDVQTEEGQVTQTWRIPSRAECLQCHTPGAGYALSFNSRQLNREQMIEGRQRNLLHYLGEVGILDTTIDATEDLPRFHTADDGSASLLSRVRSYLAVNCASCHQPGAIASTTWDARPHIELLDTGLIGGIPLNDGGNPNGRLVVPGDPESSVLLSRISETHGFSRMPNVATNELDHQAIDLVKDWIGSISEGYIHWQDEVFPNPESIDADLGSDPDGDGRSNRFEYLSATDALDTGNFWKLQSEWVDGDICLEFPVTQNRIYTVEVSQDLEIWEDWPVEGNPVVVGDEAIASVKIMGRHPADAFFRVRIGEP